MQMDPRGAHGAPDPVKILELFRKRFLHRTDALAAFFEEDDPRYSHPQPVIPLDEEHFLLAHVLGDAVPRTKVRYFRKSGSPGGRAGRFRAGAYAVKPGENTVKWVCYDFDGKGHSFPLMDPEGAALTVVEHLERAGVPAYLEKSGGGHGWHVWVFFREPVPALDARLVAWHLCPKDIPLAEGGVAEPLKSKGIEIFPKQNAVREGGGYGNLVWLPFWHRAKNGGNRFYREAAPGILEEWWPEDFETVAPEAFKALVEAVPPAKREGVEPPPPPEANPLEGSAKDWKEWREEALKRLDLAQVYGGILTGRDKRDGWLECRDPWSPSGMDSRSAQVADGSDPRYERGYFYSFRTSSGMSVFDYLQEQGLAEDFAEAVKRVAEWTGVALPEAMEDEEVQEWLEDAQDAVPKEGWTWANHVKWLDEEAPPKEYIFEGLLPRGVVGALLAEGGCGKTFWTLIAAVSLATGRTLFPTFRPVKAQRVMLLLGEDPEDEIWRRLRVILAHFMIGTSQDRALLKENLRFLCGVSEPLMWVVGKSTPEITDRYRWLSHQIEAWTPDLVVLDPKAQWDGTDENSNPHATAFANCIRDLMRHGAGSVLVTHHVSKYQMDGNLTSASGRGASGFRDACRWVANMRPMTEKQAEKARYDDEMRRRWVEFDVTKTSYARLISRPVWFQRCEGGVLREDAEQEVLTRLGAHTSESTAAALDDGNDGFDEYGKEGMKNGASTKTARTTQGEQRDGAFFLVDLLHRLLDHREPSLPTQSEVRERYRDRFAAEGLNGSRDAVQRYVAYAVEHRLVHEVAVPTKGRPRFELRPGPPPPEQAELPDPPRN